MFVRMRTVQLTPENPTLSEVPWHVEGNVNEHIAGTAIYCLESENVSTPSLSFRIETAGDQEELSGRITQGGSGWAEQAYGVSLDESCGPMRVQNYGSVEIKEGRLLAFPNVFHTRRPAHPNHQHGQCTAAAGGLVALASLWERWAIAGTGTSRDCAACSGIDRRRGYGGCIEKTASWGLETPARDNGYDPRGAGR
ncbi:hypothetical protein VUR80DRAFT_6868 [Thermomyces stellatus]